MGQKLQEKIESWESIQQYPPLKEVEALRMLDQVKQQQLNISDQSLAILYTILAFYRLKRNFNDDQMTNKLLIEAENIDTEPLILAELKHLKQFFHFYSALSQIKLNQWSIRETDFDPAKLKKMNELHDELDKIFQQTNKMHQKQSQNKSHLSTVFDSIVSKLQHLSDTLSESISLLENKRNAVPVQDLNNQVKEIIQLRISLYDHLPDVFKQSVHSDPLEQLDKMIGLHDIKKYIHQYYYYLKYQQERKQLGFHMVDEPGLHMIITGNPGTGKTSIARLLASIYYDLGLLDTNVVTEVNRSHLVGSYLGQSEENTMSYVKQSLGGILFIDEAYSLRREGQTGNDYGQAVIDTLVSSMTSKEYANRFAVILAGYPEEMRQFLWSNPGLRSRFPEQNHISLPNFNVEELLQIAETTALSNDYFFTEEALHTFSGLIEQSKVDDTFGNARTVKDLVLKAIFKKGAAKTLKSNDNWIEHMRIDSADLDFMEEKDSNQQPMQQLEQLVGLNNVKQEVKKLSSFVRLQQQRKQNGLPTVPVQLHAVFSGNPGTGKTTVANVYSSILKKCGLLKRGHVVFASRSDLVAGYVGQTAIKTKQKVREALGGVLFIDEAYSLFRGHDDFGKEAIDTLVDEMTKHNENLVIILAGYKREMERFISSNPGLESRFKKYFSFEDYQADELLQITSFHTARYQYELDEQAWAYLTMQLENSQVEGNARFIVNLIDEAIQFQALRMENAISNNQMQHFQLLTEDDFKNAWNTIRGNKK
ncbi:AAA family ATPase [Radiobacillus sp. PE A8.2]|uniref:AAA family ATPase n=1 Tax=Radiobacillus sp. PE A8.2 TaxID=3380349 RepID=UPI003890407A